jgi:hypothetical protein
MKNDSIQCDKLLIQNEEKVDKKVEKKEDSLQFGTFLDQIEKEIDMQIKGLKDLKTKVNGFKVQVNGGQNIPIQSQPVEDRASTVSDNNSLLSQLITMNKNNKNIKPSEVETNKTKAEDSANFLELLKNEAVDTSKKTETKSNVNLSLGEIEKQIELLKNLSIKN